MKTQGQIILDLDKNLYINKGELTAIRNIAIASYITSCAIAKMNELLYENEGEIVYCDTDAIHTTEPININIGDNLGQWSLDLINEVNYISPRHYTYVDIETGELIEKGCREITTLLEKIKRLSANNWSS